MVRPQEYLHSVAFLLASSGTSLHYLPPILFTPRVLRGHRYYCRLHSTSGRHELGFVQLHEELSGYINKHPDAASIVAGDFNKANLGKVMPTFHQHVSCPTRGPNTLDHCYTQFKNAYKARSLPALGKTDHAAIFLTPEYKQRIVQESPGVREVTRWSSHSEAMLQASLDDVDWDMFRVSSADVSEFTDVALALFTC